MHKGCVFGIKVRNFNSDYKIVDVELSLKSGFGFAMSFKLCACDLLLNICAWDILFQWLISGLSFVMDGFCLPGFDLSLYWYEIHTGLY